MSLFDDLADPSGSGDGNANWIRRDVSLAPYTWFKLGGPAEYLVEPRNENELAVVVKRCHETGTSLRYLGHGANVIVRDEGVAGVVVRLTAEAFTSMEVEPQSGSARRARLIAGGGADMTKLVLFTVKRGLAGLEQIAGIPGTVGGGIAMNCGGRYGEIGTAVTSVRVIGRDGTVYERDHDDLEFGYRKSALRDDCVLGARFELQPVDAAGLDKRFREIWMYKQNTQPPLGCQSVGCIFRNPDGQSAGQLIDQAGLKGRRLGTAFVSDRHANFVLADIGGRAGDVISLIELIADTVEGHCGIRLEPEVKIW